MLKSQCILKASNCLSKHSISRLGQPTFRNISTLNVQTHKIPPYNGQSHATLRGAFIKHTVRSPKYSPISLRFASTNITTKPWDLKPGEYTPQQPGLNAAEPVPLSDPVPPSEPEYSVFSEDSGFGEILTDGGPHIEKYIGFLRDMGLDYGWGTTSLVERMLEYIHIYSGTSWWVSIVMLVIAIRLSIFKFYINAQDTSARMQAVKPLTKDLDARAKKAMASQDRQEMYLCQQQRKAFNKKVGIRQMNLFYPIIFQVPLGFGTFRLLRGMATLPVPGLDEGGPLWLSDMTIPDPYFVMPLLITGMYMLSFRLGGETGNVDDISLKMRQVFGFVLPITTGIFAFFWPVALSMIVFLNGFFMAAQNLLFRAPWFRRLVRIQPRGTIQMPDKVVTMKYKPKDAAPKSPKAAKKGAFRQFYDQIMEKGQEMAKQRMERQKNESGRTKAEVTKMRLYDEKMTRVAAQRRFEAKQQADARAEERRQKGMLR